MVVAAVVVVRSVVVGGLLQSHSGQGHPRLQLFIHGQFPMSFPSSNCEKYQLYGGQNVNIIKNVNIKRRESHSDEVIKLSFLVQIVQSSHESNRCHKYRNYQCKKGIDFY